MGFCRKGCGDPAPVTKEQALTVNIPIPAKARDLLKNGENSLSGLWNHARSQLVYTISFSKWYRMTLKNGMGRKGRLPGSPSTESTLLTRNFAWNSWLISSRKILVLTCLQKSKPLPGRYGSWVRTISIGRNLIAISLLVFLKIIWTNLFSWQDWCVLEMGPQ